MNTSISIDRIDVLEWYDGWVAAVLGSGSSVFVGYLLAFEPNLRRRRFAFAPVAQDLAARILRLAGSEQSRAELDLVWASAWDSAPEMFLSSGKANEGNVVQVDIATTSEMERIRTYRIPHIENAVAPETISFWL